MYNQQSPARHTCEGEGEAGVFTEVKNREMALGQQRHVVCHADISSSWAQAGEEERESVRVLWSGLS